MNKLAKVKLPIIISDEGWDKLPMRVAVLEKLVCGPEHKACQLQSKRKKAPIAGGLAWLMHLRRVVTVGRYMR